MSDHVLPEHPVSATLSHLSTHWLLTMERGIEHPPSEVWAAFVERETVPKWAPFTPDRDLDRTGPISLPDSGNAASTARGRIKTAEKQRMLSLVWAGDTVDFELAPTASHTIVRLSHTFRNREDAASFAAGWHICLSALVAVLDGQDVPPVHGEEAKKYGWDDLRARYEELFSAHR